MVKKETKYYSILRGNKNDKWLKLNLLVPVQKTADLVTFTEEILNPYFVQ